MASGNKYRGATLYLDEGRIRISTDEILFPKEFNYGRNEDFLKVFVFSYVKLLGDSPIERYSPRPIRCYTRFLRSLQREDLREVIKRFSSYADMLLSSEYTTGPTPFYRGDVSQHVFLDCMKDTPVFKEYLEYIRTGKANLLRYILSFLRFGKKLRYEDPDLDSTAFHGWNEVEKKLSTLRFNDHDLASLKVIIRELVPDLQPNWLTPSFGPGKVSETGIADVYGKVNHLLPNKKLVYAFLRPALAELRGGGFGPDGLQQLGKTGSDIARLKFVPKDISKSRSICMEPNSVMFFQQAVYRWIDTALRRGWIRNFVDLHDQQKSRDAALHGSQYLCTDTIDLSSASDSVHVDLVKGVFPLSWQYYMLATRTSKVRVPDGSVVAVNKFAPMGSAICFPTQCIVFTAVCLYSYLSDILCRTPGSWTPTRQEVLSLKHSMYEGRSGNTPFRKRSEPPVVFGDDIAVDSRHTSSVIDTLERLGFSVNVAKSFTASQSFRESCGVYAYEGEDVTPLLFRLRFWKADQKISANVYASLIENVNNARRLGYNGLATFWQSLVIDAVAPERVPFVKEANMFGILVTNKHAVPERFLRLNKDIREYEERVVQVVPRTLEGVVDKDKLEKYRWIQWWKSRLGEVAADPYKGMAVPEPRQEGRSLRVAPQETRLAPRWARCE